jgi:hypothetical protein
MFEFHGWLSLCVDDRDDPDTAVLEARLDAAETDLRREIEAVDDGLSVFEVRRAGNGLRFLAVHGLRNHRYAPLFELFRWAARNLPDSYGLLYVRDDEDDRAPGAEDNGADTTNAFRVWRVAQGRFDEHPDPLLSPCVPTIEKPWERQ